MKISTKNQEFIAAFLVGMGVFAPWLAKKVKKQRTVKFAFVNDPTGEPIFLSPGFELITRLPNQTYVGVLTGNKENHYVEAISIDQSGNKHAFWIDERRISIAEGDEKAGEIIRQGIGIEKTADAMAKIIAASR